MRVALLSALEPLSGGVLSPRGLARIGGRTVLQNQLQYALAAGCERIACLSHDLPSELIALQHEAERGGAQFQCIRDVKPLSGMVTASDEVLVIGDGLAFNAGQASAPDRSGSWIASFPAEEGLAAGFERIDRDRSWAGIMKIPGALVEKLAEFPSDIDVQSSLLRLALQNGVKTYAMDEGLIANESWVVIDSEGAAAQFGAKRLGQVVRRASFAAPVHSLSDFAAFTVLRRHSDPGRASRVGQGLALGFLAIAALAIYFVQPIVGFAAIMGAVFTYRFGQTTALALSGVEPASTSDGWRGAVFPILVDCAIFGTAFSSLIGIDQWQGAFAVLMLLGIVRIGEITDPRKPWPWVSQMLHDRGLLAAFALVSTSAGVLITAIQIVSVAIVFLELMRTYRAKLTQV